MEDLGGQKFVPVLGVDRKPVLEFKESSRAIRATGMGNYFGSRRAPLSLCNFMIFNGERFSQSGNAVI